MRAAVKTPPLTRLVGVGMVLLVIGGVFYAWHQFWGGAEPYSFYDLNSYRESLAAVRAGATATYDVLPYPPFVFVVLWFLGLVPPVVGDQIWTMGSLLLLGGLSTVLVMRATELSGEDWRRQRWDLVIRAGATVLVLAVSMPVMSQLTNGQMSLVVMSLAFFDLAGVLPRRYQGALVGLAGALKVTPLIFIPYYVVTGQRRQAVIAAASFAAFTGVGFVLFPAGSLQFWTRVGGSSQFGDPGRVDNLSIRASLIRLWPDAPSWLWLVLGVVVIAVALWQVRRHYLRGEAMESVFILGSAAAVVAPVAWPHYFIWLPMLAIWLWLTRTGPARYLAVGIYTAYSMIYISAILPRLIAANRAAEVGVDFLVLIPVLIGLFGLPRRRSATSTPGVAASNEETATTSVPESD